MSQIKYLNRKTNKFETENVYGETAMKWAYETNIGKLISNKILSTALVSKIVGQYKSTQLSANEIPKFIKDYQINMDQFENTTYRSFNDFFIRKFKPNQRPFAENKKFLSAFAEGRYLAYKKVDRTINFPVKGTYLTADQLLNDSEKAHLFREGPMFIARLCPVDYHRFHYPDAGRTIERYNVNGPLHSVNPIALKAHQNIFIKNERSVSILKTENFGYLAYIEVGAMCVGKIIQSQNELGIFNRGDEKGYFLFGGSTVILLGEPGAFTPDQDLLENTSKGFETYIELGSKIGANSN